MLKKIEDYNVAVYKVYAEALMIREYGILPYKIKVVKRFAKKRATSYEFSSGKLITEAKLLKVLNPNKEIAPAYETSCLEGDQDKAVALVTEAMRAHLIKYIDELQKMQESMKNPVVITSENRPDYD